MLYVPLVKDKRQEAFAADFQHLEGPVQSSFTLLDDDITYHCDSLCVAFRQKCISTENWPILLVEMENVMNLRLLPNQQIEDYNFKIRDKGRWIH